MVEQDIRWKQRFQNYKNALSYLVEDVNFCLENDIDIAKRAVIKDFEMTHELAWKLMKDILLEAGHVDILGSRIATRIAFNQGLITDGETWGEMIKTRNITVHTYDDSIFDTEFDKIAHQYLPLLLIFQQRVENLWQTLD